MSTKNIKKNVRRVIYFGLLYFFVTYPLVFSYLITNDRFLKHSKTGIHALCSLSFFNYEPDWLILGIWGLMLLCGIAFAIMDCMNRKEAEAEKKEDQESLQHKPVLIKILENQIIQHTAKLDDYVVRKDSTAIISMLHNCEMAIKKFTGRYLKLEEQASKLVGINFMFYLKLDQKLKTKMYEILAMEFCKYKIDGKDEFIDGFLVLPASTYINDNTTKPSKNYLLIIPVYQYLSSKFPQGLGTEMIVPGGPSVTAKEGMAYYYIADTQNTKEYENINADLKTKFLNYFIKTSPHVKSFISISMLSTDEVEKLGVINIDSSVKMTFENNKEFIQSATSAIYSVYIRFSDAIKYIRDEIYEQLTDNK